MMPDKKNSLKILSYLKWKKSVQDAVRVTDVTWNEVAVHPQRSTWVSVREREKPELVDHGVDPTLRG